MMKPNSDVANTAIDRILELSVEAHIRRRGTVRDSAKYHNLIGAIAAYGKVLGILVALQHLEEFHAISDQHDVPGEACQSLTQQAGKKQVVHGGIVF
jgi:hypothetical protein